MEVLSDGDASSALDSCRITDSVFSNEVDFKVSSGYSSFIWLHCQNILMNKPSREAKHKTQSCRC